MKCNICSGSRISLLFEAENRHGRLILSQDSFNIYECDDCKVAFTDIEVDKDYYDRYYLKDYYQNSKYNFLIDVILSSLLKISFWQKLKLIEHYKSKGNNILEIGCAKGDFLHKLPPYFTKYGVEINKSACQHIKEHHKDITVYNEKIDCDSFGGKDRQYDVIVAWHVVEHVDNPASFLRSISKLLTKDGVIILEVPNRNSIGFSLTKKYWFHLDAPRHLFHYSYRSLRSLFAKHGFNVVKYKGNFIDYFHDLSASIYMRLKTNNLFLNAIVLLLTLPLSLVIRLLAALFLPGIAEINTYVLKQRR